MKTADTAGSELAMLTCAVALSPLQVAVWTSKTSPRLVSSGSITGVVTSIRDPLRVQRYVIPASLSGRLTTAVSGSVVRGSAGAIDTVITPAGGSSACASASDSSTGGGLLPGRPAFVAHETIAEISKAIKALRMPPS